MTEPPAADDYAMSRGMRTPTARCSWTPSPTCRTTGTASCWWRSARCGISTSRWALALFANEVDSNGQGFDIQIEDGGPPIYYDVQRCAGQGHKRGLTGRSLPASSTFDQVITTRSSSRPGGRWRFRRAPTSPCSARGGDLPDSARRRRLGGLHQEHHAPWTSRQQHRSAARISRWS